MNGLDKLIKSLAIDNCPSNFNLIDCKRVKLQMLNGTMSGCEYGDGKHQDVCEECFKKSIELNYEEGE